MVMMNEDPATLVPELALLFGAVLALLVGAWTPRRRQGRVRVLALVAVGVGLVGTVVAAKKPPSSTFDTYVLDTTTHAVRATILVAVALILWFSRDAVAAHPRESEFTALVLLGGLGSVLMSGAGDLMLLFAAFLLASVPLYALAGWARTGTTAAPRWWRRPLPTSASTSTWGRCSRRRRNAPARRSRTTCMRSA